MSVLCIIWTYIEIMKIILGVVPTLALSDRCVRIYDGSNYLPNFLIGNAI